MRFSAISEFVFSCQRSERYCLLIALIVRRNGEIICKAPAVRGRASRMGFVESPVPKCEGPGAFNTSTAYETVIDTVVETTSFAFFESVAVTVKEYVPTGVPCT